MRKSCVLILALAAMFTGRLEAAKYAGEAFSLGVGGRALALGGAVIAGPFDATAAYWNPAGMNRLHGRSIVFMHAETFGSLLNHDFGGYVHALDAGGSLVRSFGLYVYYLGGGGIKITDIDANGRPFVVDEESHGDYLFSAALAGKIAERVDFGFTAKVIYRDLGTENGYGLTVDAGALYQVHPNVTLGLAVTDLTTGFIRYSRDTFDEDANTESIYPTAKPAVLGTYTYAWLTGRFMVSGDIKFERLKYAAQHWSGPISLDTHYGWEIGYREIVFGRAGFDIGRFTAGGGIDVHSITIDFAYLHDDDLDETYRVSAGYRF